mgnify:CR=1 FL=1
MSRQDQIRAAIDKHDKQIPKTTTGKGKNYLPTDQGAGMTAKGRAEYNRKNNANLKAPARKNAERAKASMRRWNCG